MRPDLLVLDAGETVVSVQAVLTHRLADYDAETRARAAGLLRLAENRIRHARRRLEAGAPARTDAERVVDRLLVDGWLFRSDIPAALATIEDELDDRRPELPAERKETRP